jgi:putative tryptophan/tyrosine transport system substrate-binding protein
MKRREFIAGLGSAVAWPVVAWTQQPAMPVVGVLNATSSAGYARELVAFRQGLYEGGYVEGRNVAIEHRSANGRYEQLPALAADLVHRRVTVIAALGAPAAVAAKVATTTIPIVFQVGADPVEMGLLASLSRPGGNIAGVANLNSEVGPKKLQLLYELVPMATIIGLLVNPANPGNEIRTKVMQVAARTLGVQIEVLRASTERDIDEAFATLAQKRVGALVINPDSLFTGGIGQLVALTVRYAMPTIYNREFAAAGGLIGYGVNLADAYRLTGVYTGRVLGGAKPADLPVQQSTRVELVINLKTAKTLGLTISETRLATADEVIQ